MGNHRMALAGFKPRTQWDDFGFSSQRWEPLTQMGSEQPATMVILWDVNQAQSAPFVFFLSWCKFDLIFLYCSWDTKWISAQKSTSCFPAMGNCCDPTNKNFWIKLMKYKKS